MQTRDFAEKFKLFCGVWNHSINRREVGVGYEGRIFEAASLPNHGRDGYGPKSYLSNDTNKNFFINTK
jgi:hypothetical protein